MPWQTAADFLRRSALVGAVPGVPPTVVSDTVTTAPSPPTTGLTLTPATAASFPDPANAVFDVIVYPAVAIPSQKTAEILHVTALAAGVWTIERAQWGTTALSIAAGWQIRYSADVAPLDLLAYLEATTHDAFSEEVYLTLVPNAGAFSPATAEVAYLSKFISPRLFGVTGLLYGLSNASGNYDVGIYSQVGTTWTRLWSTGSLPVVNGTIKKLISAGSPTTLDLTPNAYFVAIVFDNTTAKFNGCGTALPTFDKISYYGSTGAAVGFDVLPVTLSSLTDGAGQHCPFAHVY